LKVWLTQIGEIVNRKTANINVKNYSLYTCSRRETFAHRKQKKNKKVNLLYGCTLTWDDVQ